MKVLFMVGSLGGIAVFLGTRNAPPPCMRQRVDPSGHLLKIFFGKRPLSPRFTSLRQKIVFRSHPCLFELKPPCQDPGAFGGHAAGPAIQQEDSCGAQTCARSGCGPRNFQPEEPGVRHVDSGGDGGGPRLPDGNGEQNLLTFG